MRIGGLASGIDTDSIISNMMKANRIPLTKIVQKKQYLDWQVNDFRTVNRQLNDFSNMTWDKLLNPTTTAFRNKTVEISAPNDVSIKSVSSSGEFSGTLKIENLATHATMKGETPDNVAAGTSAKDIKLEDLGVAAGTTILTIKAVDKSGVLQEKKLELSSTETLQNVLDKINKDTGVNAFFDAQTGQIAISAKNSGNAQGGNAIEITGGAFLGLNSATATGTDAKFSLNGITMTRSSNTFEVNGFEFTLKAANNTDITFSSKAAVDDIFDTVKNFVDEYNKMIEELNKKIREPKYRSYHPLSAEEKADMKENEIKLWEEKAMSGTLRNDSTITNMLTQMRSALMGAFGPAGEEGRPTLSSIGITAAKDYLENGKLIIDEAALKKAISEEPTKVEQMFTASVKDKPQEEQGFAVRLRSIVDASRKTITNKAGNIGAANDTFTLGRTLKDMNKQIERFEERMKMIENRLWKQFTAMEQAINRANAQSAQLMNALGGGM